MALGIQHDVIELEIPCKNSVNVGKMVAKVACTDR